MVRSHRTLQDWASSRASFEARLPEYIPCLRCDISHTSVRVSTCRRHSYQQLSILVMLHIVDGAASPAAASSNIRVVQSVSKLIKRLGTSLNRRYDRTVCHLSLQS